MSTLIPRFRTCFNHGKLGPFLLLVLIIAGFNLLCSNNPLSILSSTIMSKNLFWSMILYITKGSLYLITIFLENVLN